MEISSLHVLLTYQCNYECDHCFVWGSSQQTGTFTRRRLDEVMQQASAVGTIESLWFEGGEAFLYYPILMSAIRCASARDFYTGVVTNGYWATDVDDARAWLAPLMSAGLGELAVSIDGLHGSQFAEATHPALLAAHDLGLPAGAIITDLTSDVMYRGRAAALLTPGQPRQPWQTFDHCPYENLADPGRIHVDPLGNLHLCQGVIMGNLFEQPLRSILADFRLDEHPIAGPIWRGGPAGLVQQYDIEHDAGYVDACHLCDQARHALRSQFPAFLGPDQMYAVPAV